MNNVYLVHKHKASYIFFFVNYNQITAILSQQISPWMMPENITWIGLNFSINNWNEFVMINKRDFGWDSTMPWWTK